MDSEGHTNLAHLHPGFHITPIIVSVDRVVIRYCLHAIGYPHTIMKSVQAIDVVWWDEEGTRMIGSLRTRKGMETQASKFTARRTYRISRYCMKEPGLGVHPQFHIEFDELSSIDEVSIPFVDRVFNLRCPSDIHSRPFSMGSIYDVCGFVRYPTKVEVKSFRGFMVRELLLILESRLKEDYGNDREQVKVYLRGDLVDRVSEKIQKLQSRSPDYPFILVKHVTLAWSSVAGLTVLHSVDDATRVRFKPDQPEVIAMRCSLLSR